MRGWEKTVIEPIRRMRAVPCLRIPFYMHCKLDPEVRDVGRDLSSRPSGPFPRITPALRSVSEQRLSGPELTQSVESLAQVDM